MRKYLRVKMAIFKLLMGKRYSGYHLKNWCTVKNIDWTINKWVNEKWPDDQGTSDEACQLLASMTELAIPSLRERVEGPSRNRRHFNISIKTLREQFLENVEELKPKTKRWNTFLGIFEDFIKIMKSFKDFNMESLSDFLATNEQHDLWLIVAKVKDYNDESAEDRFSL